MKWFCRGLPSGWLNDDAYLKEAKEFREHNFPKHASYHRMDFFALPMVYLRMLKALLVIMHGTTNICAFQAHAESNIGLGD